jgi:antitoxin PrlF
VAAATVTSKGQITIPIEVRTELGLKPGDRIEFVKNDRGGFILFPKNGSVQRLKGMLGKFPRTVSIEEINESIAARGARQR